MTDTPLEICHLTTEPDPSALTFDLKDLQASLETLCFLSDQPLSLEQLKQALPIEITSEALQQALDQLMANYQTPQHGFELVWVNRGYQFRTKSNYAHLAKKLVKTQIQRLSSGAMECLAIIAYQQPILKEHIDSIRGVDSSYFIRILLERKLIQISGRSELPGRPILYTTTSTFLEVFSLPDLTHLPPLRELEQMIPSSESSKSDDNPQTQTMRRLVQQMQFDTSQILNYNPKDDETILHELRQKVAAIATSTPYLDALDQPQQNVEPFETQESEP